jgi:hypothetical protein
MTAVWERILQVQSRADYIDKLIPDKRQSERDPQPAKRVALLKKRDFMDWNAFSGNAVEPIAACHKITRQFFSFPVLFVENARRVCIVTFHADRGRFIVNDASRLVDMRFHQVGGDLGLPIDHHDLAVRVPGKIDPFEPAVESNVDPFMDQALAIHALACFCLPQQICHALFDHPCPDATRHIFATATLQDHRVDALKVQQPRQQKPRGARTNNANLCSHVLNLLPVMKHRVPQLCL